MAEPAPQGLRSLRRAQIVGAARAIVARDGLEALTIAGLEQQLGYSRGVITYHFANKEEIVEEVLRSVLDEIDQATRADVAAAPDAAERIGAVLHGMVRGLVTRVEAARILISFWGRIPSDARIRQANARLYARYREETARLLGGARGVDGDVQAVAALVVGVVIGIAAQAYFEPGAIDVEATVAAATRAVRASLPAGRARPSKRRAAARTR